MEKAKTITTKVHFYYCDIDKPEEAATYEEMMREIKAIGYKPHTVNTEINRVKWDDVQVETVKRTEVVFLETKFIFDNQWNGSSESLKDYRFFDWLVYEFPNKKIKAGYWIEPTYETADIRGQFQCRYCGHINGYDKGDGFHHKCLSSPYLKQSELYLPTFARIHSKWNKDPDWSEIDIPDEIKKEYLEKQKEMRRNEFQKQYADFVKSTKKKIADKEKELKVWEFLSDHDFLDFKNLIYYSHSETFCFGWRETYSKEEGSALRDMLEIIGFEEKFGKFQVKVRG